MPVKNCIILFAFTFALYQSSYADDLPAGKADVFTIADTYNFDHPPTKPDTIVTIPFNRAGNLIIIKGKADSTEGNFILDTGAPGLVLNLTYFRDYTLTQTDASQTGITGSSSTAMKTNMRDFSFGTFNYSNIEADVANLGHIENSRNIRILGLI